MFSVRTSPSYDKDGRMSVRCLTKCVHCIMYGKNDFVEVSKYLAKYRCENNFFGI